MTGLPRVTPPACANCCAFVLASANALSRAHCIDAFLSLRSKYVLSTLTPPILDILSTISAPFCQKLSPLTLMVMLCVALYHNNFLPLALLRSYSG